MDDYETSYDERFKTEMERLYKIYCEKLRENGVGHVAEGVFGADMQVSLVNSGPVTIIIDSRLRE